MTKRRPHITLIKQWGEHATGTKFYVLAPGEDIRHGVVDPQRAASLLRDRFAVEGDAPEPEAPDAGEADEAPVAEAATVKPRHHARARRV